MKNKIKRMVWLIGLSAILIGGIVVIPTGCGSTPIQTAVKSEAAIVTSVSVAMTGWGQWVAAERRKLDKRKEIGEDITSDLAALEAKRFRVKDLYGKYQIAMRTSLKVTEAAMTSTNKFANFDDVLQAVTDSQAELLSTIAALQKGKSAGISKTQKLK